MKDPSAATVTPPSGLPVVPDVAPWCALAIEPASARLGRAHARAVLAGDDGEFVESVVLVVAELVANAVVHGPGGCVPPRGAALILLSVQAEKRWVLVGVRDPWPGIPARSNAAEEDESGRGLRLVDELAASRWTHVHERGDKTVYALLLRPGQVLAPGERERLHRG